LIVLGEYCLELLFNFDCPGRRNRNRGWRRLGLGLEKKTGSILGRCYRGWSRLSFAPHMKAAPIYENEQYGKWGQTDRHDAMISSVRDGCNDRVWTS